MKKALCILLLLALALTALAGCGGKNRNAAVTSLEQLKEPGRKIGVGIGTGDEASVIATFPDAEVVYYNNWLMGYSAVVDGKVDAFAYGRRQMELAIANGAAGVALLDETIGEGQRVAVGLSPVTRIDGLRDSVNAFIAEKRADGTLDDMYYRWIVLGEETLPEIETPERSDVVLRVGTTGVVQPFSYYVGTELRGYDVELAYRFAAWLGAELSFKVYDYDGVIAAAQSGDVDCIMAELFVTPERSEAIPFSDPLFVVEQGVVVRAAETEPSGAARSMADLKNAVIGVQTGTTHDGLVLAQLPDAQIRYYNSYADLLAALRDGRIDAFPATELSLRPMLSEYPQLRTLEGSDLMTGSLAFAARKSPEGQALCDEFSAWFAEITASGEMEALLRKWNDGPDDERTVPDWTAFPAERGVLRMATEAAFPPYEYYLDGKLVGIEIDLAARFCEAKGYGLEITDMSFESVLPSVTTGKSDFAASGIAVTEARKESMSFSEPYYTERVVLAVMDRTGAAGQGGGFWQSVKASFEKTFIRENRWKLFVQGIGTTLLITALSIVLGTALGFGVFLLCRKGNPIANGAARFFVWLVQGMPMVVLLMILYYIIFGSVAISGTIVAVIGFTLVFGAGMFSMLKSGVGAVDKGQTEAAWALGYSDRRAFFRVVLPQALPHFFPAYKGEITATVKATAIVGYVAVQDLTKMGDIVRSRTYDAFFPLIAVAVIYFLLAAVLTAAVNRIGLRIDPRQRKRDVLKGVIEK